MRTLIASMTMLLLASCGFQPMYSSSLNGGGPAIGNVQISEISGKAGHVLRTELTRILGAENDSGPPARLDIALNEDIARLGIRLDESATRAELRLTANYVFTAPDGRRVTRGSLSQVVVYQIPDQAFGEIAAQDDARERAAETLAQRFRQELAMRMAQARADAARRPPARTPAPAQ